MAAEQAAPPIDLALSPHVAALGIEVVEQAAGRLVLRLPAGPALIGDPDRGLLFGGAIFGLMDTACGFLAFASAPAGRHVATLDLRVDYLAPASGDRDVFAEALTSCVARQVVFCRASAWQESPAQPIASALGSFMINEPPAAGAVP